MANILQQKYKDNYLISSYDIGKSRPVGYNVPNKTYGKQCYFPDRQEAKDVVNDWQLSNATDRQKKISSFVEMNILGAKKGVFSLKGMHDFRQKNQIAKQPREGSLNIQVQLPDNNFIYGKPNWQDQSMSKLLQQDYKKDADSNIIKIYYEQEKRDKEYKEQCKLKHTQSNKNLVDLKPKIQENQKELFKMKKFQNVDSRYKSDKDNKIDWQDILNKSK